DVVRFQQPASGTKNVDGGIVTMVRNGEILEMPAAIAKYMELNPVTGVRDLADSAASSLAQWEMHRAEAAKHGGDPLTALKDAYKYMTRVEAAEQATKVGRSGGDNRPPEL